MFRLSCFCIGNFPPILPSVKFRPAVSASSGTELSEVIEPVQSNFLSCTEEKNIFTNPCSISECAELLDGFASIALHSGYVVRAYVDFFDKEQFLKVIFFLFYIIYFIIFLFHFIIIFFILFYYYIFNYFIIIILFIIYYYLLF